MERVCEVPGCNRVGQHMGNYRKDGSVIRRKHCSKHHGIKYGLNGWDYKQHRKNYCENIDGRLGFKCTTTITRRVAWKPFGFVDVSFVVKIFVKSFQALEL